MLIVTNNRNFSRENFAHSMGCNSKPLHPTVLDWRKNVISGGGANPSQQTMYALNEFYKNLKETSFFHKIKMVNCIAPNNLIASLTPLITTLDGLVNWSNNNLVASDLTINGLAGNGTSKWADTGINSSTNFSGVATAGITIYRFTSNTTAQVDFGTNNTSFHRVGSNTSIGAFYSAWDNTNGQNNTSATTSTTGYISCNRTTVSNAAIYLASSTRPHIQNGTTNANNINADTIPNSTYGFLAQKSASTSLFSSKRLSFIALHEGLIFSESNTLFDLVQKMRQRLGGGFL